MPDTPTQAEVIRRAIEAHMQELHTAMPVRVISYNASRETVDLVPQFQRSLANDPQAAEPFSFEDLPTFPDVPVMWPSGGGGSHFITFPLAKNDTGLAVFCERDLGVWRSTGQVGTTGDQRTHGLAGAVFYPGLRPNGEKLGSGKVGSKLTIGSEVLLGATTAAQALMKGTLYKANEVTWLAALSTWVTAVNTAVAASVSTPAPAKAALLAALGVFTTAITTFSSGSHTSTKHKLDS